MPAKVLIVGGSFGGLATAYELRRRLSPEQAALGMLVAVAVGVIAGIFPALAARQRF